MTYLPPVDNVFTSFVKPIALQTKDSQLMAKELTASAAPEEVACVTEYSCSSTGETGKLMTTRETVKCSRSLQPQCHLECSSTGETAEKSGSWQQPTLGATAAASSTISKSKAAGLNYANNAAGPQVQALLLLGIFRCIMHRSISRCINALGEEAQ